MSHNIFIAGASGVIGRRLLPLLKAQGHRVLAITRSADKVATLQAAGARAQVLDVLQTEELCHLLEAFQPQIVIHQLTDLPAGLDPARMQEGIRRNAEIRRLGTASLIRAAQAGGAQRLIAQSIAWAYAPGPLPQDEQQALETTAPGARGISVNGIADLERQVLGTPGIEGLVLRYGRLFGGDAGMEHAESPLGIHVDAAAHAALLAIHRGVPGCYNLAQAELQVSTLKARQVLGWQPDFRLEH
ncbi:NAD-dependent epimerase/dehydratase family protein [Pseudomonas sp. NPDC089530]|uniref:NAD-dependent epimerase/dehydratase family protein n=1 Tax=Pseudomonas sp. NPDC089530 TaxID=3390651 RepID=UPI003D0227D1